MSTKPSYNQNVQSEVLMSDIEITTLCFFFFFVPQLESLVDAFLVQFLRIKILTVYHVNHIGNYIQSLSRHASNQLYVH